MIIILILAFLILICVVKVLNNDDIAKQCCKNDQDLANIKNARKVYSTTKESLVLLIVAIVVLIVVLLLNFTNIEYLVKDYFSTEIFSEDDSIFSYYFYLIPIYILVARQIVIEVKISEFLYKFFNITEPELEENLVKSLLYKKAPVKKTNAAPQVKLTTNMAAPKPKKEITVKEMPKMIEEEPPKEETKKED